ncbi:Ig-like domain-containing protein [Brachybacterium sp. GCM10030267]|uniref:Ig-like domain-containing protein n=1 Tax=Brachybacterium sp. GCM10030267 TaxID=3273381 RepID=UPI003617C2BB
MSVTAGVKRRRRRTTVASSAVLSVIALVVTGFALNYPGLTSSDIESSNGGVWVMNQQDGLMGRMNVDAGELDARLATTGDDLDIIQSGTTVFETGSNGMTPINTASVQRGGLVDLPPETDVKLGGDRVVIAAPDGRFWILSPEEAAAFTPSGVDPNYTAEDGAPLVTVSSEGTVFLLDGDQLLTFPHSQDTRTTKPGKPNVASNVSSDPEMLELTAVGEKPVILDKENGILRVGTEFRTVDLTDQGVSSLESARLQKPSPTSKNFALATADSLFVIPFSGGDPQEIPAGGTGEPVVPAQAKGCVYGAWNKSMRYVRACEGQEPVAEPVPEADTAGDLTLRVNNDLVVLNDQEFGLSWKITDKMQIVDDWVINQDIKTNTSEEKEKETLTTTITNIAAERDEENRPPTANDDEFGVRPGQSVVLPVTRNDTDPDGDILTVSLQGEQPSIGTVTPIRGGTQMQIEVADDANGSASFTYVADDGRGQSDTATVTLDVHPEGENSAPAPAEDAVTKVKVRSGEEVSVNIKPYWEDPEGDAFYLANATTQPEDIVTFRPDGQLTFNDAGLETGTKQVQVTFRDEFGETAEGTVEVEAVSENDIPPVTTADHASVVAGQDTTIEPLANDLNPNGGDLELTNVSETEGLEVEPALDAGTVSVSGESPGTYYLEYTVAAAGSSTATQGLIRIDVIEPASEELAPVAVDDMATVTTGSDTLIDPLENDVDPTGGVLVVNSVSVPENSGLKATIVSHHLVRVEAEPGAEVSDEPVALTYEIANSAGTTTGTIRTMVASTDTQFANPSAVPDEAVVRAGDMVNIDVVGNDVSPTDLDLHLGQILDDSDAETKGHAETHEDQLRFTADDDASGEAVVTYEVVDESGRTGSARATITIVPRDAPNTPPEPDNLTARTVAGTPVRIPVPTTGIDADGDSVMLTGITSPTPQLGEVTEANGQWIEYVPHEDAAGTDRFSYQVMDRHGAIGTADVQVGVAPPNEMNLEPYAVDDTVEVKPDREVQIPVLENDTDPEGAPLSVVREDVEAMTDIEVADPEQEKNDGVVTVTTPSEPGTHTVLYSASDGQLKSSATITIKVDPNAPERAPIARDDFVSAEEVLDPEAEYVDVDVLANDSDPDGSTSALKVSLDEAPEGTQLRDDGIVRVTPQEEQQRLRYIIEDVDGLTSAGYVWVPGTSKQAPVWVGEPIQVQGGAEATVDLSDSENVRVRPGAEPATITDPSLVTAAHSDGSELVQDESTLAYRPAEGFSGKDTISVEVTDGEVGDATAATATLAIPVEVAPEDSNLPPTLQGAVLEVEQGGPQASVDLAASAEDPEGDELTFSLGEVPATDGVSVGLEGSTVTAKAGAEVPKGTIVDVPVSVTDGHSDPVPAKVQLTVGGSNRPLLAAVLDKDQIDAGQTKSIDVLANDSNPFPGGKREVVSPTITSGEGEIGLDGNKVTITPDAGFHGILTAQYGVKDDTGDPDRQVTGEIRVTVRAAPEPPSAPRIGEVGDGFVELNFKAGADNGAPITGYEVSTATGPSVTQECASTSCTISGLQNDVEYTFQVVANNEVGPSKASVASATARPDVRPEKPETPSAQRGDQQLTVGWSAPVNHGSAIQKYDLQMQDTATGELHTREVESGSTELAWEGLTNGTDYRFRVRAHNLADQPSDWSGWSRAEHPAGKPAAPSGTATAERVSTALGGSVKVTWPKMTTAEANGEPITEYIVKASSGAEQTVDASTRSATFRNLDRNKEHTFTYIGVNSVGRGTGASSPSEAVVPWAVPDAPTGVKASLPSEGKGDGPNGRAHVEWNTAESNGTEIKDYVITWSGGGSKVVDKSATSADISGLTNGKAYRFQVQARNRFTESDRSGESNSVKPYTKPAKPQVSISTKSCTNSKTCPVSVTAEAPGGDGGGGGKTLEVWVDGSKKSVNGNSYSTTITAKSGSSHSIEARVVNGKGLSSDKVSQSKKAQTYTPPDPAMDGGVTWGDTVPAGTDGCDSGNCRYFRFSLKNLEPGATYKVTLSNEGETNYKCFDLKAGSNGRATTAARSNFYGYVRGGEPDWPLTIKVGRKCGNTKVVADGIYMPS